MSKVNKIFNGRARDVNRCSRHI